MAPRTAKAKKAADVKVENEAPKKGRGKVKGVEDPMPEANEVDLTEKDTAATEKRAKRGKKTANDSNGQEQANGVSEESVTQAKKGKKKNIDIEDKEISNGEDSPIENMLTSDKGDAQNSQTEADQQLEAESVPTGKGKKRVAKREAVAEKSKENGRAKKNAKTDPIDTETAEKEVTEEKPKQSRGRGRKAQPKMVKEEEMESDEKTEMAEVTKEETVATKGRKKALPKSAKEKSPSAEIEESQEENIEEEKAENEPAKKAMKGRKAKKATSKEEAEQVLDEVEQEAPAKKRKVTKKEEKEKGDSKTEEASEEPAADVKPVKGKRGQKKAAEPPTETDEDLQDEELNSKRRRKPADEKAEDTKKAPLKNKAVTDYECIDFSNTSKNAKGKDWNFKIASWNVDGIRAWMNKGGLDYIKYEKPDILCLQEVKCAKDKLPAEVANPEGYHAYWLCSDQDGYAGVGIYTTKLAMNVQYGLQNEELDSEGRIITAEYEQFYLICTYVPNAGRKLVTLPKRLQWNEEFRKYVKELDKKKPVIICGDMNVAHNEIDLANPKTNKKNAGFTMEERSGMTDLLGDGFVDTFRHLNPTKSGAYTFWTYMMNSRAKNVGWRLDYFIVSERLLPCVCDSVIRDGVYGSDHCPITLFLHLTTADKPKE